MKSDLEKRLEYVRSQREILQRTEEKLQKQLDAEKPEFDFRTKMPVGPVWLGINELKIIGHNKRLPVFAGPASSAFKSIYHAHQIVKAAQEYTRKYGWAYELSRALEAAEQDGVLQNLE